MRHVNVPKKNENFKGNRGFIETLVLFQVDFYQVMIEMIFF